MRLKKPTAPPTANKAASPPITLRRVSFILVFRRPREGGDPVFNESEFYLRDRLYWMPAFAGMTAILRRAKRALTWPHPTPRFRALLARDVTFNPPTGLERPEATARQRDAPSGAKRV